MAGVKVTYDFANDKYSWSENHYWITASNPTVQQALNPALQLANLRIPLLGNNAFLTRIRLGLYPANRQVFVQNYFGGNGAPTWPADPTGLLFSSSRSFTALLLKLQGAQAGTRNMFIAGVPASLAHSVPGDTSGLQFQSCPGFQSRFFAYINALTSGQWGWLTRTGTTFSQVQALVTNAAFPSMVGFTVSAAIPGLNVGQLMQVKGFRRINTKLPAVNGVWTCGGILAPVAPATQWTYFLLNSGAVPTNNYKGLGQAGLLYLFFETYTSGFPVDITERKRGGSIGRPRGRLSHPS